MRRPQAKNEWGKKWALFYNVAPFRLGEHVSIYIIEKMALDI